MAIYTSILTGGANSHTTTSEEGNAIATDFVSNGIVGSISNTNGIGPMTGGYAVNAQTSPNMTVAVTAGKAYATATPTGQASQTLRVRLSTNQNVTIAANITGGTRYDWLYIKIDADKAADSSLAGDDVATLATSRSTSLSTDDGTPPTYGYCIAKITVANGASTITNGNITDRRAQASTVSAAVGAYTTTSVATLTPNPSTYYGYFITAQAETITIAAPTGTVTSGQTLLIRIKDNGTARTITWNAIYRAIGVTLPTATVISKTCYVAAKYNSADTKWDVLAVAREA